jgi:hypothetical protein
VNPENLTLFLSLASVLGYWAVMGFVYVTRNPKKEMKI